MGTPLNVVVTCCVMPLSTTDWVALELLKHATEFFDQAIIWQNAMLRAGIYNEAKLVRHIS